MMKKGDRTVEGKGRTKVKAPPSYPLGLVWTHNPTNWPNINQASIDDYLTRRTERDGLPAEANKSLTAFNYVDSGHVGTILSTTVKDNQIYIRADVCPSQSLNAQWHTAWICTTPCGIIKTAGCTCKAGQGAACSHASAIAYYILAHKEANHTQETCTEMQRQWNQGTKRNVDPRPIADVQIKKPKPSTLPQKSNTTVKQLTPRVPSYKAEKEYYDHIQVSGIAELFGMPGSILNFTYQQIEPEDFHSGHEEPLTCHPCNAVYTYFISLPTEMKGLVRCLTENQSVSELWKEIRKIRITASTAKNVPKNPNTHPFLFLTNHIFPTFTGNSATRHGNLWENHVLKRLEDERNLTVTKCGVIIDEKEPWLCASPDGLLEQMKGTVEVKCPKAITIFNFIISCKHYDAVYDYETDQFSLNRNGSRGYYLQCQITMFVSKTSTCLFSYYLEKCNSLVSFFVPFDEKFTHTEVDRRRRFYFQKMLPYVTSQLHCGSIELEETKKMLNA